MKKSLLFVASTAMLLFSACCGRTDAPADTIKVLSYNIRVVHGQDGPNSWEFRKEATPAMILANDPDILGVQEACPEQIRYIRETCPHYASVGLGRNEARPGLGERPELFWNTERVQMLDWGVFWLSDTPDEISRGWDAMYNRVATWGLFEHLATGKRFISVNTHFDHIGVEARKHSLGVIRSEIAKINKGNLPWTLTGDFNMGDDSEAIVNFRKEMNDSRVTAVKTDNLDSFNLFGEAEPGIKIDFVFYDGFGSCLEFRTIQEQYAGKPYISDHYPVVSTLKF